MTVKLSSFPVPDGTYSLVGGFGTDDWNTASRTFAVAGETGTTGPYPIKGTGPATWFTFSITKPATWDKPWYEAGKFGSQDDNWDHLTNFAVLIPFDHKNHRIELSYPTGFVLPKILVDGTVPGSFDLDPQGRIKAMSRPDSSGTFRAMEAVTYAADGSLLTWSRQFGSRTHHEGSSVWTYDSLGHLKSLVEQYSDGSLTLVLKGIRRDRDGNPVLSFTEIRPDGVLKGGSVTDNGEETWGDLSFSPTGGVATQVTVPAGTVSAFQGNFEGWSAIKGAWNDGDLSTAVQVASDPDDPAHRVLQALFSGQAGGEGRANFQTTMPRLRKWSAWHTVRVTATNPGPDAIRISFSVQTGTEGLWQEPFWSQVLPPNSTRNLYFDLDQMKSSLNDWSQPLSLTDGDHSAT